jgi:hypothetical protein
MIRKIASDGSKKQTMSGGCLVLFALPFFLAGLFMSYLYFSGYTKWLQARSWEEVPCWIESVDLESKSGDSTTYLAKASYRYKFAGRTYHGERVSFHGGSDNIGSFQQDAYEQLKPYQGKSQPFRCYVNPARPEDAVIFRDLRWPMQLFLSAFSLTFPAVGAGLMFGGLATMRDKSKTDRLHADHPHQPWRWKLYWEESAIQESNRSWHKALSIYAIWSGLIILPLILGMIDSRAFQESRPAWLALLMPFAWSLLAWSVLKRWRHFLMVGKTSFVPNTLPIRPGSKMRGDIVFSRPLPTRGVAKVKLEGTISTERGGGDSATTITEPVWSQTEMVPLDQMTQDMIGSRLPVVFILPRDAPESSAEEPANTTCTWKLHLEVPGTPVRSVFELPVFGNNDESIPDAPSIADKALESLPDRLAEQRITTLFDQAGHLQSIVCPPARNRGVAVFLLFFNLIWTAAAVFLVNSDAPFIFKIIWPVTATLIWVSLFWMTLHGRTVRLNPGGMEVHNSLGPLTWKHSFTLVDILDFTHDTNMSSGHTAYYRVRLSTTIGKTHTLVDSIVGEKTAEAMVEEFKRWRASVTG